MQEYDCQHFDRMFLPFLQLRHESMPFLKFHITNAKTVRKHVN